MGKGGPGGCKGTFHSVSPPFSLGLQHQGIFRVSGSQVEVNDIKNSFERGNCKSWEKPSFSVERGGIRPLPSVYLRNLSLCIYFLLEIEVRIYVGQLRNEVPCDLA